MQYAEIFTSAMLGPTDADISDVLGSALVSSANDLTVFAKANERKPVLSV